MLVFCKVLLMGGVAHGERLPNMGSLLIDEGARTRSVVLPAGRWKAEDGELYRGGKTIRIDVPLERLPYFRRVK